MVMRRRKPSTPTTVPASCLHVMVGDWECDAAFIPGFCLDDPELRGTLLAMYEVQNMEGGGLPVVAVCFFEPRPVRTMPRKIAMML